jgi:AmmeMemoRadiSam system protein B
MPQSECPQLRPFLAAMRDERDPDFIILWDKLGLAEEPVRLRIEEFFWLQQFDGRRTLRDVQADAMRMAGGQLLPLELFTSFVEKMEAGLYLDGPRFRGKLAEPIRQPACIGCYLGEPEPLRTQLKRFFTGRGGPGLPRERKPDGALRAALIPHIDYSRGGHTFAWGFKEVVERADAALFVIIGTSHYSAHRFTLTRKSFLTPLGIALTDQRYIDRLVKHYGDGLFDDEIAHLPEHSIELEVVFLQFLYENKRPIRIVPLLVGPFQDCVETGKSPTTQDDVGRMIEALRRTEAEMNEPICYIISGDLAHIGPKFGDPEPVDNPVRTHSRAKDEEILKRAEAADAAGYFQVIAGERDRRRICGLPPTFTLLEAVRPGHGKLLHYDQYVHPLGYECVSFASVAFYQ